MENRKSELRAEKKHYASLIRSLIRYEFYPVKDKTARRRSKKKQGT
jgi:hypothetical protein